jgi:tetratricopeptide (TPR) repeat protein
LEEEGRTEDAALLVRDKLRTQSEDLELSLKYFSLLKKSGNTLKMTAQGAPLIGLLLKEKKSKEACGVYKECVKQDPDFGLPSELNFEIAGCLLEHHQSKPALNAYIRFIKANPGHQLLADSYFQAAKLFNEVMKDPGKAHEILAMLVKKYSGHQRHPDFQKYLDEMNFVKL